MQDSLETPSSAVARAHFLGAAVEVVTVSISLELPASAHFFLRHIVGRPPPASVFAQKLAKLHHDCSEDAGSRANRKMVVIVVGCKKPRVENFLRAGVDRSTGGVLQVAHGVFV